MYSTLSAVNAFLEQEKPPSTIVWGFCKRFVAESSSNFVELCEGQGRMTSPSKQRTMDELSYI